MPRAGYAHWAWGAAIGWGLAREGQRVAVLDEGDVAYRASRGNFALVWVQSKGVGHPEYALWTMQSSCLWPQLADAIQEETGIDVCFGKPGGLHLLLSERELEDYRLSKVGFVFQLSA